MNKPVIIAGGVVVALGLVALSSVGYQKYVDSKETADANWTLISNADDGGKWYVDESTFNYEGGRYAGGWIMLSQARADKDGTRSIKFKTIFDCQDRKYRFMQGSGTDGINGRGAGTGSFPAGHTRDIPPSTNISNVADYICRPLYTNPKPSADAPQEPSRSESLKQI